MLLEALEEANPQNCHQTPQPPQTVGRTRLKHQKSLVNTRSRAHIMKKVVASSQKKIMTRTNIVRIPNSQNVEHKTQTNKSNDHTVNNLALPNHIYTSNTQIESKRNRSSFIFFFVSNDLL